MPKRFKNRRAREIRAFLNAHGFFRTKKTGNQGDDDIYEREGYGFTVKIPNRDNEEIPEGTMRYIVKSIGKCGVKSSKEIVLEWWIENGYRD